MLATFQSRHERYVQWMFRRCEQRDMRQLAKKAFVLCVPNAVMQPHVWLQLTVIERAANRKWTKRTMKWLFPVKTYMCGVSCTQVIRISNSILQPDAVARRNPGPHHTSRAQWQLNKENKAVWTKSLFDIAKKTFPSMAHIRCTV